MPAGPAWGTLLPAAVVLTIFCIYWGYFALFEILWNGQTPGKRLAHIRVIRDTGRPIDATAAVEAEPLGAAKYTGEDIAEGDIGAAAEKRRIPWSKVLAYGLIPVLAQPGELVAFAFTQLLLDRLQLLPQVVLPLRVCHLLLRLRLDLALELEQRNLPR